MAVSKGKPPSSPNSRSGPVRLADFLPYAERVGRLGKADRLRIVEQALLLLEMNYVHLPLKRAMHAINPIQQLRLLRFHLMESKGRELTSSLQFHRQMLGIFASARDLHTLYLLPDPYRNRITYLPFLVEQYYERKGARLVEKFIIARTVKDGKAVAKELPFDEAGVEVIAWNGIPIRRAVELNGEVQSGGNLEARLARGLDSLTIRPIDSSPPPDELWVDVTYRIKAGPVQTTRWDWLVTGDPVPMSARNSLQKRAAIDIRKSRVNEFKRKLFAAGLIRELGSIHGVLRAEVRTVKARDYGYIRLYSFDMKDADRFVSRVAQLITRPDFPQHGLILDVRGNGGGKIRAGERLLQLFTPNRIKPELFEFLNTPLNLEICRKAPESWNLGRWVESMTDAVSTGAAYSYGFPLNSEASCNDIGQVYFGPVVLITDALSYSTTDIFAAGFQDNGVGVVLGTSGNTGAGGANVWWYDDLRRSIGRRSDSPFKPLPHGADMLVAMRRSIRVGRRAGRPLEELGITPDERHYTTRRDVLEKNADLITRAAAILRSRPSYRLSLTPALAKGSHTVVIEASSQVSSSNKSAQIARIDVYAAGRPITSIEAVNGEVSSTAVTIRRTSAPASVVEIHAVDADNRVAALRRLKV